MPTVKIMFNSARPEFSPWDSANILINGSKHGTKQIHQQQQNHSITHFAQYHASNLYYTRYKRLVGPSIKLVSLPHFTIANIAQSNHGLPHLDVEKSSHTESDTTVDNCVPVLDSSSKSSTSPSLSLDDPSLCEEERPTPFGQLLHEEEEILKADNLLHCEETLTPYKEERRNLRLKELLEFMKVNGHANVPHKYPKNQRLARWVKRQRRQYKLLQQGKPSNMTLERIETLNSFGFIWGSHKLIWRERIHELQEYFHKYGHCNVQNNYKENKKLGIWVKCQRREYKLYRSGKPTAMDSNRVKELEAMGFEWEIRKR